MRAHSLAALVAAGLAASGCASALRGGPISLPGVVAYQDSTGPNEYRSAIAKAPPARDVEGRACQYGLQLPIPYPTARLEAEILARTGQAVQLPDYGIFFLSFGWGQGGFADAMAIAERNAGGARLYDVRADMNTTMVLGIWRQECVVVRASVAADRPADPKQP